MNREKAAQLDLRRCEVAKDRKEIVRWLKKVTKELETKKHPIGAYAAPVFSFSLMR